MMTCEEFELTGLDFEGIGNVLSFEKEALEHVSHCARCAALQESWQAGAADLRERLREVAVETSDAQAPARVEMRLRLEFRKRYRTAASRQAMLVAAWALATTAVFVGTVSWWNWRHDQRKEIAGIAGTSQSTVASPESSGSANVALGNREVHFIANADGGEFMALPGSLPGTADETEIVRVGMQRGALRGLGLPVNEERAGEWIQVDLLVGNDGLPQAVRLLE